MLHFNELSLHGQFASREDVESALARVLAMRRRAVAVERPLMVTRGVAERPVIGDRSLRALLGSLERGLKLATLLWLDRDGPFWDEGERHPDDYFQCDEEVVTDTGIAEAAHRIERHLDAATVSARPSAWERPILQVLRGGEGTQVAAPVPNFVEPAPLDTWLAAREAPIASWPALAARARSRFVRLRFAEDVIASLDAHPFHAGAAERVLELLAVLDRLASCVEATGAMSSLGVALLQTHFVGDKAWFSDSSDGEKVRFRNELTFRHPSRPGTEVFATWHGKVKIGQLRIHYDHTFRADEPVSVVYIGPKITKA